MNTWERNGSGHRPDAPRHNLWCLRLLKSDQTHGSKNVNSSISKENDISSGLDTQAEGAQCPCGVSLQQVNHASENTTKISDISAVSCTQSQKSYGSISNSKTSDQCRHVSYYDQNVHGGTGQNISKADTVVNDVQGRYIFARTRSSPELTETYGEYTFQGRQNRVPESGKTQIASRKNMDSDMVERNKDKSSSDDSLSVRCSSAHQSIDAVSVPKSLLTSCQEDSGLGTMGQDFSSIPGAQGMHQEEQDLVNMIASSEAYGFNGQILFPLNLVAASNADLVEPGSENFGFSEMYLREAEHELWHEHDRGSSGGFDLDNGSFEMLQSDDKQQSTSARNSFVSSSRVGSSDNSTKLQHKFSEEIQGSTWGDHIDVYQYQYNRGIDVNFNERISSSRPLVASHTSSYRSTTSSENSWEGPSAKVSKPSREKRGRKTAASVLPSAAGRNGKIVSEHSSLADDGRDWNPQSLVSTEMAERTIAPQPAGSLPVTRHQMPGSEAAQTDCSDPLIHVAALLLGNWNTHSKSRAAGGSHSRNQNGKSMFTFDQFGAVAGESKAERPCCSHRHDSFTSYQSHNGSTRSNSSLSSCASMPYGVCPLPAMNTSWVSYSGPYIPSAVMLYPYDHNSGHASLAELLEIGSLGPRWVYQARMKFLHRSQVM
ncbi:Alpha/beta-Hydrolases superfamily protein [Hibiscus syriacus]|uniref:Alpha/beta-Hydrolases superfamily protein n=1 Tax=Hibiscus syriacus TaxID=106335 RepID=A0A6A3A256_HIBSY|nr:Alpha/beta-Hydrolases superfamily protein [Hibiscus syriacus]